MATLCNCGGNGSLDHSNFAHVQLHQICVDAFNVDVGNTDTQHHQNKTFAMWLMDEDHFEDHTMFLISLVFNVSLVMMPVFAWLEADLVLAGIWWLWAGLLALLLIMQSSTWVSFALYSLRTYPRAFFRWKAKPQVPMGCPRSSSRRRHRRRPRRSRSRGSRSANSTATQTDLVIDTD